MSKEIKLPKIEKGIPLPGRKVGNGISELIRQMKKGDSVLFDTPKGGGGNYHTYARFAGMKVATRTLNGGKNIRVWRIE